MLWDVREDAFVRCTNERKEEGDSQRIQLSSLHREFTDVSAIIALLCGFYVCRIKCWMPAASRRNDKDEVRGWKGDMGREGGLIRLVGKINAVCSKRIGSTPGISCHCSSTSTEIHRCKSGRCNLWSGPPWYGSMNFLGHNRDDYSFARYILTFTNFISDFLTLWEFFNFIWDSKCVLKNYWIFSICSITKRCLGKHLHTEIISCEKRKLIYDKLLIILILIRNNLSNIPWRNIWNSVLFF